MTVDLFIPCHLDNFNPETAWNVVKILEYLGLDVAYNSGQTCCGLPAFQNGHTDIARSLGQKFTQDFKGNNLIVCPSASCAAMVKKHYTELFYNTSLHNECKQLQSRIWEFSDFLVNKLGIYDLSATFEHSVSYHASCTAAREYGLKNQPLLLLQHVKGMRLCEMELPESCCGAGAGLPITHPGISEAMLAQKLQHVMATGASHIVSTETSCLMAMQSYFSTHNIPMKAMHLADILASGL